jgi:hypothetical protein
VAPGVDLAAAFFREAVGPVLDSAFPDLPYAAARLGSGSDVLGFDDDMSTDHDFGCRLNLLLDSTEAARIPVIVAELETSLPESFAGHPVRFPTSWKPAADHNVEVATVGDFFRSRLGVGIERPLSVVDWLCLTGQSVLEVTAGPIFHDGTTQLGPARQALDWYPTDVWLYVLASGWVRLSQEMPFVGRTGHRGDDAGSRVIAARLARDLMHLAFLIERRWPPYPKWTGTALRSLASGPELTLALNRLLTAPDWVARQACLVVATEILATRQAVIGLPAIAPPVVAFYNRPFMTPSEALIDSLTDQIRDPEVLALPRGVGSIEQWCDNVDVLSHPAQRTGLPRFYLSSP